MLAHDADLGLLREGILEPIGEPIRHGVAHHHDRGRWPRASSAWARARANSRPAPRVPGAGRSAGRCRTSRRRRRTSCCCCCCYCCWRCGRLPQSQNCACAGSTSARLTPAAATATHARDLPHEIELMIAVTSADLCRCQPVPVARTPARQALTDLIVRQKCQLEDGRELAPQSPCTAPIGVSRLRSRSRIAAEANPSGTWPTDDWNWRSAVRVLPPSRPSGSPTSKPRCGQMLLQLVALRAREHALVARPGAARTARRRAAGRRDGRSRAHRPRPGCIS